MPAITREPRQVGAGTYFGHVAAGLVAFVTGIVVAVWAVRLANGDSGGSGGGGGEPWASGQEVLRTEGLFILLMSGTWLVLGAVLHTPMALRRGARVRAGWTAFALLLALHLLIGLLAVPLAELATPYETGSRRGSPGSYYGGFLGLVLLPASLIAVCGLLFPPPGTLGKLTDDPGSAQDEADRADDAGRGRGPGWLRRFTVGGWRDLDPLSLVVSLALLVSLMSGWLVFSWIMVDAAGRFELPLTPDAGMPIVAVGVALAVPSAAVFLGRRLIYAALLWDHVSPRLVALGAPAVLLVAVLGAQLTRVLPAGLVTLAAIFGLPSGYWWTLRRLHARPAPAEE